MSGLVSSLHCVLELFEDELPDEVVVAAVSRFVHEAFETDDDPVEDVPS